MAEKLTRRLQQHTLWPASYYYWSYLVAGRPSGTCTTIVNILETPVLTTLFNKLRLIRN